MVALDVPHRQRPHRREHFAVDQRHQVGRVIENTMPPRLGFQQQRKGRIAADIDPLDRVHLHGDVETFAISHIPSAAG